MKTDYPDPVSPFLELGKRINPLKLELEAIDRNTAKWNWPESALAKVEELRKIARENTKLIRGDLDKLLNWPDERSSDPELFYGGKHDTFIRDTTWFADMGFARHETMYTFTDTWDCAPVHATFLVPDNIQAGKKVPIVWFFHGGGLCTGANNHIPWYSQSTLEFAKEHQAVIIAPDYPLGPEANYRDILRAVKDFLRWYKEDGYFKADKEDQEKHWKSWLLKRINAAGVELDTESVYVEGESAGGAVAVTALWANADKKTGTHLPIKAALLRYPMIAHYKRDFPPNNASLVYMGKEFTRAQVEEQAQAISDEVENLDWALMMPMRMKGYAPQYMSGAFLLSTTKLWQKLFQRTHEVDYLNTHGRVGPPYNEDLYDSIARAEFLSGHVNHDLLPPIVMYHGYDDTNCPIADTEMFKSFLVKYYPSRYVDGDTVVLHTVTQLEGKLTLNHKKEIVRVTSKPVGHGFDYDLERKREPFLKEAYGKIQNFWIENASSDRKKTVLW